MRNDYFEELTDEEMEVAAGGCGWGGGCRPCGPPCGGGVPVYGAPAYPPAAPVYGLGTIPGAPAYGAPAYGAPAYGFAAPPRWKGWRR